MKKLFINDKFFLVTFIIAIISLFTVIVLGAVQSGGDFLHYDWFLVVIYFISELTMFVSYKNHNKNVMKGMIGATLMAVVLDSLFEATVAITAEAITCGILCTIIAVVMFIVHFLINSDHHSNPNGIVTNIVCCIAYAVVNIIFFFVFIGNWGFNINSLLLLLSDIGVVATIVCIEAKLDTFRINREESGWSEEKGYPEGYVHESEKNQ